MKKAQQATGFLHGNAYAKALMCLAFATGGQYVLAATDASASLSVQAVQQKSTVTVKGVVKDANGEPIIGATVVEKGNSSNGTVTNLDGRYTLTVPRGATLTVSYIGFTSQDTKGGEVLLQEDLKSLSEVVVIGYGTQKKLM